MVVVSESALNCTTNCFQLTSVLPEPSEFCAALIWAATSSFALRSRYILILVFKTSDRAEQAEDRRLFGPEYQDHSLIFCQPSGAYYSPDRLGARVKELMGKVGLEGVSLHSLRHTNATELLRNGVPLAEVSRRLGHADQNITLAIYSHAVPADSRAAAKIWDDALGVVIEVGKKAGAVRMVAHGCTERPKTRALVGNKRS